MSDIDDTTTVGWRVRVGQTYLRIVPDDEETRPRLFSSRSDAFEAIVEQCTPAERNNAELVAVFRRKRVSVEATVLSIASQGMEDDPESGTTTIELRGRGVHWAFSPSDRVRITRLASAPRSGRTVGDG